jgi:hypothetical protein
MNKDLWLMLIRKAVTIFAVWLASHGYMKAEPSNQWIEETTGIVMIIGTTIWSRKHDNKIEQKAILETQAQTVGASPADQPKP